MHVVVGIDVSSKKANVAMMVNQNLVNEFQMTNDRPGFMTLLTQLKDVTQPEIIFEATGVYSRRLETFLNDYGYCYRKLNPLAAKKLIDRFRPAKSDLNDARHLAQLGFLSPLVLTYRQDPVYQHLMDLERFYQEINHDVIQAKNRLHRVLQLTFPEIESFMSSTDNQFLLDTILTFPTSALVLAEPNLSTKLIKISQRKLGGDRAQRYADKLHQLASQSYVAISTDSPVPDQVRYLASEVGRLTALKTNLIKQMVALAEDLLELTILKSIPGIGERSAVLLIGELGDIRRFKHANQLNTFIGINPVHYESGEYIGQARISKRGSHYGRKMLYYSVITSLGIAKTHPNHIADFYRARKRN